MKSEKTIDVLNNLIQINNDRIEGYETASKETKDEELKDMFDEFIANSEKCKTELSAEVISLGGTPTESTKVTGKFFRVWMDMKAALTGNDRKNILDSCEYGEDVAKKTYQTTLEENSEDLSLDQQSMIQSQLVMLKEDHDSIKSMRDMLV
jgi:uncharacterized protein (TIGR02284 family)